MPIATGLALGLGLGVAGATSLGASAIQANAAGNAANAQVNAADYAAQLQSQEAQNALNFQEQVYNNQQQQEAPWLGVGQAGLANLANLLGIQFPTSATMPSTAIGGGSTAGGGGIGTTGASTGSPAQPINGIKPFNAVGIPNGSNAMAGGAVKAPPGAPGAPSATIPTAANPNAGLASIGQYVNPNLGSTGSLLRGFDQQFTPPTLSETNDPGYMARLNLAQQAIQNSAAARGGLLSGNTLNAENQFTQDYASNEYGNVYNRALGQYQQNYNIFENNQTNTFNRLAALAGLGQTATSQLNSAGANAASGVSSTLLNAGNMIGQNINNAGAARGSGYVGQANAYSGGLQNLGNLASLYALLNQNGGGGMQTIPTVPPDMYSQLTT
jgi:hypothetical protein